MKKKKPKEEFKKLDVCKHIADNIYKTNPTYKQLLDALYYVYGKGYEEAYQDAILDSKKLRDRKEKLLLQDFNDLRDAIEDKIHETKK